MVPILECEFVVYATNQRWEKPASNIITEISFEFLMELLHGSSADWQIMSVSLCFTWKQRDAVDIQADRPEFGSIREFLLKWYRIAKNRDDFGVNGDIRGRRIPHIFQREHNNDASVSLLVVSQIAADGDAYGHPWSIINDKGIPSYVCRFFGSVSRPSCGDKRSPCHFIGLYQEANLNAGYDGQQPSKYSENCCIEATASSHVRSQRDLAWCC